MFCWGLIHEVKEYNIAVNDLYPTGGVKTDGFYTVFKNVELGEERLGRMKIPEQIAEAALWIANQDAGTFTDCSVNDDEVKAFIEGQTKP